jgi:SAM-dependent methyltransferase
MQASDRRNPLLRGEGPLELSSWRALMAAGDDGPAWFATDNGFLSAAGMASAHAPLVAAASLVAPRRSGTVVDLGCGNGALLAAICDRIPALRPVGVDRAAERLAHARIVLPGSAPQWFHGDLFAYAESWCDRVRLDIVYLMLGRLLEVPFEQAEALRNRFRTNAEIVLGYAYPDWLDRYGDLVNLAQRAGVASMERLNSMEEVASVRF